MNLRDMDAIFNTAELATQAYHTNATVNEYINVIFDTSSDVVFDSGNYQGAEASVPMITVKTKDTKHITHNSLFTINDQTYGVIEVSHQNSGTTKIYLDKK